MNLGFCGQSNRRAGADNFEVSVMFGLYLHGSIVADCLRWTISQPNEYATRTERNYEYKHLFIRFLLVPLFCIQ
jgi:hypothetical protein